MRAGKDAWYEVQIYLAKRVYVNRKISPTWGGRAEPGRISRLDASLRRTAIVGLGSLAGVQISLSDARVSS
jgi:hypothetical protein